MPTDIIKDILTTVQQPGFGLTFVKILWVNILLSGDNAVVIALACRQLPPRTRSWGIGLGAGVAVLLRIIFTGIVATLLVLPWLKFAGGLALLYIALALIKPEMESHNEKVKAHDNLWRAVGTIAVADIVMSLDNVVAIAAIAQGNWVLLFLGLAISIPLIIVGAALITMIFERWPILIWAGAGLLGWIAGDLMLSDPAIVARIGEAMAQRYEYVAAGIGAVFVIGIGYLRRQIMHRTVKPAARPKRIAKEMGIIARRPRARAKASRR